MKFQINSEVEYSVYAPSTMILSIHALRTPKQTVLEEALTLSQELRVEEFSASNGNRFMRLHIQEPISFKISYKAVVDTYYKLVNYNPQSNDPKVFMLDGDLIQYLFPSRYCQSDKLQRFAWKQFGQKNTIFEKVVAITEWIFDNVAYVSGSTDSQTSAYDTMSERAGVCRDFAHLGIALCRALSIPARYFTCYAYQLVPQDFHACFEAYIDGEWILFDATKLVPLNGLIKIATGRDAADAAVATIIGNVNCDAIHVGCDVIDTNFQPFNFSADQHEGLSYE